MSEPTPAKVTVPVTDFELRFVEDVVSRYCHGRIPQSSVSYHLRRIPSPHMPPAFEAAFEDACNAYRQWLKSEVGDVDYFALEPDLRHPEVWAETCKAALDDELAALVRVCKSDDRTSRKEIAA